MNNDKQTNEAVAAKLRGMRDRAVQEPISYKPLFDEAIALADELFMRAMRAEAKLHAAEDH